MLNDQPYLFQNRANTIEKITHQYHMHEIYEKAAVIYNELVENPPNNVNGICACANDLTENGVMTEVVNIARQLKHFGGQSRSGRQRYRNRNPGSRCQSSRCASCGRGCTSCSHCRNAQSFRYDDTRCDVNVYGRGRRPCNRNYYVGKRSELQRRSLTVL